MAYDVVRRTRSGIDALHVCDPVRGQSGWSRHCGIAIWRSFFCFSSPIYRGRLAGFALSLRADTGGTIDRRGMFSLARAFHRPGESPTTQFTMAADCTAARQTSGSYSHRSIFWRDHRPHPSVPCAEREKYKELRRSVHTGNVILELFIRFARFYVARRGYGESYCSTSVKLSGLFHLNDQLMKE